MTTVRHSETTHGAPAPSGGCGCPDCAGETCRLDCLDRPRFFCGQLLTDQDLTAIVDWTEQRLRRVRHRHGWGVVCGLGVRCGPRATAIIEPGYAVTCCGEDVVVCEEGSVDLGKWCPPEAEVDCGDPQAVEYEAPPVRAVDLFVRFRGEPVDGRLALGRTACTEVEVCEHSRIRESFEPVVADATPDDRDRRAPAWGAAYTATVHDASRDAAELRAELRREPLRTFCFVDRWVEGPDLTGGCLPEALFWVTQDRRNAFLACACPECEPGRGVLLARVWLSRTQAGGCVVDAVDPTPPHRRPFGHEPSDCRPAGCGQRNLGDLIWRDVADACCTLADLGITVDAREWWPNQVTDLGVLLAPPLVPCDGSVVLRYLPGQAPYGFGGRVVAIEPARAYDDQDDRNTELAVGLIPGLGEGTVGALKAHGIHDLRSLAGAAEDEVLQAAKTVRSGLSRAVAKGWISAARDRLGGAGQ